MKVTRKVYNYRLPITTSILALFLLTGCSPALTNQQIIAETKLCTDAGLKSYSSIKVWGGGIKRVTCSVYNSGYNFARCKDQDKKVVDIKIECKDGKSGCTDIYYFEDGSTCKD